MTDADLTAKQSQDSKAGATTSSLGDASMADLGKGFFNADVAEPTPDYMMPFQDGDQGGFLGRPTGYER